MKIYPVGAELFHAVGQTGRQMNRHTDMTKVTVAFGNFASAAKNKPSLKPTLVLCNVTLFTILHPDITSCQVVF